MAAQQAEREHLSVVMFPWLAHGHITPYLELARRLTSSSSSVVDVTVHFVSTPVNLSAISRQRHHHETTTPRLRFVDLHLTPTDENLPPALHTTKHLPPHLMPSLKRACDLSASQFGSLLDDLHPRPDLLLFDFLYPWAPLEAAKRGVPAVHLSTCSAAAAAFVLHCLGGDRSAFPFRGVGFGSAEEDERYTALFMVRDHPDAVVPDRDRMPLSLARSYGFVAVKTCAEIERPYLDYLSHLLGGKEVLPVGPLLLAGDPASGGGDTASEADSDRVMRWMDAQPPASVVLVSFGSEYFMSEHQLAEMARGLQLSGERFLWVVRFPKDESTDMADGEAGAAARDVHRRGLFADGDDGTKTNKGRMVEGWLPQRRVLEHGACGAFLSHCGWSSVLESMAAGVPIVALPMHIDQPLGANLAAELGAAVRVPQRERFGEFRAEDVAGAVRKAMRQGGEESRKLRRRAKELSEVVTRDDEDETQVDELVRRMASLCGKGQQKQRRQRVAVPN